MMKFEILSHLTNKQTQIPHKTDLEGRALK